MEFCADWSFMSLSYARRSLRLYNPLQRRKDMGRRMEKGEGQEGLLLLEFS